MEGMERELFGDDDRMQRGGEMLAYSKVTAPPAGFIWLREKGEGTQSSMMQPRCVT